MSEQIRLMKLSSYRDYWTVSGPAHMLYGVTFPKRSGFSRTKFESIMSLLHISDHRKAQTAMEVMADPKMKHRKSLIFMLSQ